MLNEVKSSSAGLSRVLSRVLSHAKSRVISGKINHSPPKVVLVHDYLKEYGGAESVLETLSDIFPQAPIYTSLYHPASFGPHRSRLQKKWQHRIHQSFFRLIPFAAYLISPLRFLSPLAFRFFDFSHYDFIIVSATGAYFPNALRKKHAKLICYCHTPPRYLYGLATARNPQKGPVLNAVLQVLFHFFRLLDFTYAQNVDQFIANSKTTTTRIKKFYRRPSLVINPPVSLPKKMSFPAPSKNQSFFLAGGRLARAKRYDLAIHACNQLHLPLKIFGRDFAGHEAELKKIAGPTIEFLGEVSDSQKFHLMSQAQALIFCSDNEDFGIIPVEAMACGCPVIGHNSGGTAETIINGKTGILFNNLTTLSLISAIRKFQKSNHSSRKQEAWSTACRSQARQFSRPVFVKKIQKTLNNFYPKLSYGLIN